jgi:hypothetical protein
MAGTSKKFKRGEGRGSFLKKRTKKLLLGGWWDLRAD